MNIPNPDPLGSLVTEHQGGAADRDAAAVLDPDTYVRGAPFDAMARLRANSPVHPVTLPGLPRTRYNDSAMPSAPPPWPRTKNMPGVSLISRSTSASTMPNATTPHSAANC